jgi:hypothetical protein
MLRKKLVEHPGGESEKWSELSEIGRNLLEKCKTKFTPPPFFWGEFLVAGQHLLEV